MVFYGIGGSACCINGRAAVYQPPVLTIRANGVPQIYIEGNSILPSATYPGLHSGSSYVSSMSSDDGYYNLHIDGLSKTIGYFPKVTISGIEGISEFPEESMEYTESASTARTAYNLSGLYKIPTALLAGGGEVEISTSNQPMRVTAISLFTGSASGNAHAESSKSKICPLYGYHTASDVTYTSHHKLPTSGVFMAASAAYERFIISASGLLDANFAYWSFPSVPKVSLINTHSSGYATISNSASGTYNDSATARMTASASLTGNSGSFAIPTSNWAYSFSASAFLSTKYVNIYGYAYNWSGCWSGTALV